MLKTRYRFLKRVFPHYVIIFKIKNGEYLFDADLKVLFLLRAKGKKIRELLEEYKIHYLVISNMEIVDTIIFDENFYEEYQSKYLLYRLICVLMERKESL